MADGDRPPVCDYQGSDYQQRFWGGGQRAYEDQAEALALARLLPPAGGWLLELGAGAGRNTSRYRGFERVALLDYSRSQLEQAQARLGDPSRYLYIVGDVYRLPFAPASFSAATMIRTLHHMAEPERALAQVALVLAAEALFVLEYPNKRNLKSILRWLLARQDWNPFDPEPVEFAELNYDFHPAAVERWLGDLGFERERRLAVSSFRLVPLKRHLPLRLLLWLEGLAQGLGGWCPLSPSVFLRCRLRPRAQPAQPGAFWRCPGCQATDLTQGERGLRCAACGRLWGHQGGIYDFREPLEGPPAA